MKRILLFLILITICSMLASCNAISNEPTATPDIQNNTSAPDIQLEETQIIVNDITETPPTQVIEVIEKEVVPLDELHVIDSSYTYNFSDGDITDTFGNKHHTYHTFRGSGDENYAIFYLNGKYRDFSGGFVLSDSDGSISHYYAKIYADGKELYKSGELTRTTGEVDFSLDVTGCQQLRIEVEGYYHGVGLKLINAEVKQ